MAGERSRPPAAAEQVGERDRAERADEGGQRRPSAAARRSRRRSRLARSAITAVTAEPGAGRDAEQVRVGQRVAEHALVAAAGQGQHRADQQRRAPPGAAAAR